mmetsp:Transcript_100117/g.278959  ORF Transcript_100117/g.278959 Transcript_100117/m.278959 type:complete len:208 (-) Transcript_100117:1459-2082(-)
MRSTSPRLPWRVLSCCAVHRLRALASSAIWPPSSPQRLWSRSLSSPCRALIMLPSSPCRFLSSPEREAWSLLRPSSAAEWPRAPLSSLLSSSFAHSGIIFSKSSMPLASAAHCSSELRTPSLKRSSLDLVAAEAFCDSWLHLASSSLRALSSRACSSRSPSASAHLRSASCKCDCSAFMCSSRVSTSPSMFFSRARVSSLSRLARSP